jgi:hypothetical protein
MKVNCIMDIEIDPDYMSELIASELLKEIKSLEHEIYPEYITARKGLIEAYNWYCHPNDKYVETTHFESMP